MIKGLTLIVGGARGGKSSYAQDLAAGTGEGVLFVATASADDEEMRRRIEKHRLSRPDSWRTLETTSHLARRIGEEIREEKVVLIDCITLLVNNVIAEIPDMDEELPSEDLLQEKVTEEIGALIEYIEGSDARFIIVTNEVGLGLVPANELGRLYRDILGRANQQLARHADEVYLMVCGLPLLLKTRGPG